MDRNVSQAMEMIWNTLQCGAERLDVDAKETEGDGKVAYKLSGYKVGSNYRIDIKQQ